MPFTDLNYAQKGEARETFSVGNRQAPWDDIKRWAFAVRRDGKLSKCPYIEPVYNR